MNRIIFLLLVLAIFGLVGACGGADVSPDAGQNIAVIKGCAACHAVDDTPKIGPTWVGLYGSQVELDDGSFVTADDAYLNESIKDPNAKIVNGFSKGSMPPVSLTDAEINALVAYIKSVR
ncbi:MAG: cytochrome c [Anaerolineales bacterium]|nr:cytochrome c [Anaerolineales bacterium]